MNHLAAECMLAAGTPGWAGLDPVALAAVRAELADKVRSDPDFWSVVGQSELALYEALASGELAARQEAIASAYTALRARVHDPVKWSSVLDQLDFVLPPYLARCPPDSAEHVAAQALRSLLTRFLSG
jgi:hypothetical protein